MSTNYPGSLDAASNLYDAVNNLQTTVASQYTTPATSLVLADATGFPATGNFIYVGGERATYTGKTGNTLTGVAGLGNNHNAGETVALFFDAAHYNNLRDAVLALETLLGISNSADTNSIDYIAKHKPNLASTNPAALGAAAPGTGSTAARDDHVHPTTGLEVTTNKSTDLSTNDNTHYPTTAAVKVAIDTAVAGLLDDRGSYNASGNAWPSSGGSGAAGAILKGDCWYISTAGTLGGTAVSVGDTIRALVDAPGTTASNWDIIIAPVSVAGQINSSASKSTPAGADIIGFLDSAASWVLKKLTFTELAAWLASLTLTFTNKRITARVVSVTDTATAPVNIDVTDIYKITALAQACTFAAPSGTPADGDGLIYYIKDNGIARALAFNAVFVSGGATLPTTTVAGKGMRLGFIYDSTASTYDLVALAQEP